MIAFRPRWLLFSLVAVDAATPGLRSQISLDDKMTLDEAGDPDIFGQAGDSMATFYSRNGSDMKKLATTKGGGTACDCICGGQQHWNQKIFKGNVVTKMESHCHDVVCARENIPGLESTAKCTYKSDLRELTGGTICNCKCGGRPAWQDKKFHGNVVEEQERACKDVVCPKITSIPGQRFDAQCVYKDDVFAHSGGITHGLWSLAAVGAIRFALLL